MVKPSERRISRSPEVQDNLERSTKKTKRLPAMGEPNDMEGIEGDTTHLNLPRISDLVMEGVETRTEAKAGISYKNILTGASGEERTELYEEALAFDDEKEHRDGEGEKDYPMITLTKEEKVRLR